MLTLPTCSREFRCRRWSFTAVMMRGYHLMKAARSQPAFRARDSSRLKAAIMRFWKVNQPGRNFSMRRKLFSRRNIHLAADGGMSALGHERTYAVQKAMSALPPKADILSANRLSAIFRQFLRMHDGPIVN